MFEFPAVKSGDSQCSLIQDSLLSGAGVSTPRLVE